jgi:hypothetical protein
MSIFLASGSYCKPNPSPAHLQLTPAVETVEKVPFRKLIFGKWDKNNEKRLVFCVPTTFWRFLSLLWEIFVKNFQAKGFSTVSLGGIVREYPIP